MSGSSISRKSRVELDLLEAALERLARRRARPAPRGRPGPSPAAPSPGGRIWSRLLGDDVGDRLAAQRGVEDVRRDLGVEGDDRHGVVVSRISATPATRTGLTSCPTSGVPQPLEQVAQGVGRLRALRRDDPAVRPGDGQGERRPAPRPRIVGHERDTDRRLRGQPRLEVGDPVGAADLDPARVADRRRERRRQVVDRLGGRLVRPRLAGRPPPGDAATASKSRRSWSVAARRSRRRTAPRPSPPADRRPAPPARSRSRRRPAAARSAPRRISPAIGGRRSMSVRNSYSRNRRTTVSRS